MKGYRRIYFDKETGIKIAEFALDNNFIPMTIEQEIASFKALSERNRDTFSVLELEYDQYAQDFAEGRLIGVDLEKKTPIFEYSNSENPEEPIVPLVPLSVKVEELEVLTMDAMVAVTEVYEETMAREAENVETMLGLTEAYEYITFLEERIMALEEKLNG